MAEDGFNALRGVDYSEPCITAMREVSKGRLAAVADKEEEEEGVAPCEVDYQAGGSLRTCNRSTLNLLLLLRTYV